MYDMSVQSDIRRRVFYCMYGFEDSRHTILLYSVKDVGQAVNIKISFQSQFKKSSVVQSSSISHAPAGAHAHTSSSSS